MMKKNLESRLEQLKEELRKGQIVMEELDTKKKNLEKTLLRIEGAIQVLEEEIARLDVATPKTKE